MKEKIKKYSTAIIAILIGLLALKSCQSCVRKQSMTYIANEYHVAMDSVSGVVLSYEKALDSAWAEVRALEHENMALREHLSSQKDILEYVYKKDNYIDTNSNE